MKKSMILAKCLKTYPDEDDMQKFCDGEIKPCEVKIYHKGKTYAVAKNYFDPEYFKPI